MFYLPNAKEERLTLDSVESKHLVRVLRKNEGDVLHATDGQGHLLTCCLLIADPRRAVLEVQERELKPRRKHSLTLALAPTKNMDRMEWLVEKATEIGIEHIVLLQTDHSERKVVKPERLERIALSAMKQSLRTYLPSLSPLQPFQTWIKQQTPGQHFICHLDEANPGQALQHALTVGDATVLIGPEGDFSPKELEAAKSAGFEQVTLGRSRLRTETAALAAVHIFSLTNA